MPGQWFAALLQVLQVLFCTCQSKEARSHWRLGHSSSWIRLQNDKNTETEAIHAHPLSLSRKIVIA